MRLFLTTIIILIMFISCSSTENKTNDFRDSYAFKNPITVIWPNRRYRFNKEFLNIRHPFSILSNNIRYGVFVENNVVHFKYPSIVFPNGADEINEVKLWVHLINPNDKKKIKLKKNIGSDLFGYEITFLKIGEDYIASCFLPDGLYIYWPIDYHYNPCWYYEGFGAGSFFVVGNKIPNFDKRVWVLNWLKWPGDESQRPAIDQARKIKN